jgi:hypothetical protein
VGICKRISAEKKSASASSRAGNLLNYITTPELANGQEKCVWSGAKGFLSNTHEGRIAEMISLAGESRHSKDPLDHWMISLHDDEKFSQEQAEQAVDIFLQQTGLGGHQCVWGVHDDTKNRHIHIAVNRVNPETMLVTKINKGFNKEAGQQVIALIEHTQGWKSEKGARYTVVDGKPVMTDQAKVLKAERTAGTSTEPKKPKQKAQDMEQQTGTKSAQRIGIEDAAPIIERARTWRELHDNLMSVGMRYVRKGSGAIIHVGDVAVKASDVSRAASLAALQKRLGAYQPAQEINRNEYHHHRPIDRNQAAQQNLAASGKEPAHGLRSLRECDLATLQEGRQAKRAGVLSYDARPDRHRNLQLRRDAGRHGTDRERADSNHSNTTGTGRTNQGLRAAGGNRTKQTSERERLHVKPMQEGQPGWAEYQVIKAERKAAKDAATTNLQSRQQAARDALFEKQKAERSELFGRSWNGQGTLRNAMLSIIATRHAAEKLELREQQKAERQAMREQHRPLPQFKTWKEQPQIVAHIEQIEVEVRPVQQPQLAALLRSLRQSPDMSGHFIYRSGDVALFRDEGKTVAVLDQSSRSIAAALAVAQSKFGQTLTLTGSLDFQFRAVRTAVEYGLSVKFKDPALEEMRLKLIEEKRQAERAAQAERTAAAERESERAQPSTIQPAAQQRSEQEDQMATQEQRELAQAATDAKKANPQYQPSIEVLKAVDEVQDSLEPLQPMLSGSEFIAQQDLPRGEPYKTGSGKAEFIVLHVADTVVVKQGKEVAEYPSQEGSVFQANQRVVINKDGSLSPGRRSSEVDQSR